jgi:hypothetical protein
MPQRDREAGVSKNDQEGADSAKGGGVFWSVLRGRFAAPQTRSEDGQLLARLRVVAEILAQRFPREPLRLALLASVEEFAQFVDEGVAT